MDLRTRVVFHLSTNMIAESYTPNGRFVGPHQYDTTIKNLDGFRNFLTLFTGAVTLGRQYIDKATYLIIVERRVIVSDEADRVQFKFMTFPDKPMSVILSTTGELLYAGGIEPLLRPKNPNFYMEKDKLSGGRPIYLESFDGYDVKYRPLTQDDTNDDIVIDSELNHLWGKSTEPLINMLSKTTEPVRGI